VSTSNQRTTPLLFASIAFASLAAACFGANPFITSIYTADPSAHVWADGRLYVYPSRDIDPPRGCDLMDRYHVFSTADMVNWRDEGEILRASQVEWGRAEGGFMWAPDCAFKDGKYYYYFPHPSGTAWNKTWKIGVAISTKPASDFKSAGFIQGLGGDSMIDPCVFIDSDGQAYMYYGGGARCAAARLKPSMTEIDGESQPMTGLTDFHEAAWVFKRKGIYYLTYADNHPRFNRLQYATSNHPLGPWTSKGVYLDVTDCDTSHGSVVEFKGKWYQFYHNCSLSGRGNLRSICVDVLNFDADGNILKVVQTKTGVPSTSAVKYGMEAATVGEGASIDDDDAAAGGKSVKNLHLARSYVQFDRVNGSAADGRTTLDIHYATDARGKLRLTVNGDDYSFLNTFSTGGFTNFSGKASLTIPLPPGPTNIIRLTGGNNAVNVDYITLTPVSSTP